jgi:hypothetical protein
MVLKNKWKTKQLDYVLAFPGSSDRECLLEDATRITVDEPGEWALRGISTARNKEDSMEPVPD